MREIISTTGLVFCPFFLFFAIFPDYITVAGDFSAYLLSSFRLRLAHGKPDIESEVRVLRL